MQPAKRRVLDIGAPTRLVGLYPSHLPPIGSSAGLTAGETAWSPRPAVANIGRDTCALPSGRA
jgi:hypothetical protein